MSLENIHKLQMIQNHAARLVKKASKQSSAKLLLKDLHWLPVKDRIIYKIAVLVFNIINNNSSPSVLISESSSQFTPPKLKDLFFPHKKAFLRYLVKILERLGKDLFLMLPLRCGPNYQNT